MVACPTYGVEGQRGTCIGWARNDAFGAACRSMCRSSSVKENHAKCQSAAIMYCGEPSSSTCTDAAQHDPACGCLRPDCQKTMDWGTTANSVTFEDFEQVLANNPDVGWIAPQCLWHACSNTLYANTVLGTGKYLDPKVCPNYGTIACVAKNINATISGTRAQSINILKQQCGTTGSIQGSSTSSSSGSSNKIIEAWTKLPMSTRIVVIAGVVVSVVVLCSLLAGWKLFSARRDVLERSHATMNTNTSWRPPNM